jgi:predicted nucleic acid-binding protein
MSKLNIVVINAGPLMALAKINMLHLLKDLYQRVYIPQSVYNEVVVKGLQQGHEDAATLALFLEKNAWQTTPVTSIPIEVNANLDRGERDVIALALTLKANLVLMDEIFGRFNALELGLPLHGTLGILIEAYRHGNITADQLQFYFAELARRNDVWISRELTERLLSLLFKGKI